LQIYAFKLIDGFKAKGKDVESTEIVDSKLLSFVTKNVSDDGVLFKSNKIKENGSPIYRTPYREAEYKGLTITYSENENFRVKGSIHKYYNNGLQNFNDFTETTCKATIVKLCKEFRINPSVFILENLEIGINFLPPINTNDILDLCFLHSTIPFESKYDNQRGRYIQSVHSQYIIKIYNKALQYSSKGYKIDKDIMRFEIKFTVMEKLNNLGIYTLADLLRFDFKRFKRLLLNEWDKVFFFDKSIMYLDDFNQQYASLVYWKDLLKRDSKSAYYKHRRKLNEYALRNSDDLKGKIKEAMSDKIDLLNYRGTRFERLPIISIPVP
jgi:hypothetical protein